MDDLVGSVSIEAGRTNYFGIFLKHGHWKIPGMTYQAGTVLLAWAAKHVQKQGFEMRGRKRIQWIHGEEGICIMYYRWLRGRKIRQRSL